MIRAYTQKAERTIRQLIFCILHSAFCILLLSGCAALTNPVADGIPVRYLPPEVLGESKHACQPIPLTLLQHKGNDVYRLGSGDVLGIWIEGVLGDRAIPPPVQISPPVQIREQRRLSPSMGYPVPVREDGTIVLPMIAPVQVQGKTLIEVDEMLRRIYIKEKQILQAGNEHIYVTLLQPRHYHVVVLRQEASVFQQGTVEVIATSKRGVGFSIDLPDGENDVLHALTVTGGLPGLDVCDEVIIQRGCFQDKEGGEAIRRQLEAQGVGSLPNLPATACVRIPLRWKCGEKLPFGPDDVVLHDGDIVLLHARDEEVYYTGGLLTSAEHILPRDRDLDVVAAVAAVRGPLINGAFANNNLSGNLILPGIGFDNPSLLVVVRRLPNGGQLPIRVDLNQALRDPRERILVRPGDLLILQEMPNAALARYVGTTMFNFNMTWIPFHSKWLLGATDLWAPQQMPGRISVGSFINQVTTP
jgi:protein involved in polysaccharide export with SLBB domain